MAQIREHIAQLNKHFAAHSAPIFHCFALDEDTVTFKVSAGAATGEVSVSSRQCVLLRRYVVLQEARS